MKNANLICLIILLLKSSDVLSMESNISMEKEERNPQYFFREVLNNAENEPLSESMSEWLQFLKTTLQEKDKEFSKENLSRILFLASRHGDLELIELSLKKGADVNSLRISETGIYFTPITVACLCGQLYAVLALLKTQEIDFIYTKNYNKNKSLLYEALMCCKAYFTARNDSESNSQIVYKLMESLLKYLVEVYQDTFFHLHKPRGKNNSILHEMIAHVPETPECYDIIKLLLCYGANPNHCNKKGKSPLHLAMKYIKDYEHLEGVVQLLDNYKVNFNLPDKKNNIPLHAFMKRKALRCDSHFLKVLSYAIHRTKNINSENNFKQTPLHFFVKNYCINEAEIKDETVVYPVHVISTLIEHQAQVNKQDSKGRTALHYAARHFQTSCVGILLYHGADCSIVDKKNKPAHKYTGKDLEVEFPFCLETIPFKNMFLKEFLQTPLGKIIINDIRDFKGEKSTFCSLKKREIGQRIM